MAIDENNSSSPRAPLDAYTREGDLVVTYPKSSQGVRTQVYWHVEACEPSNTSGTPSEIDLWVSAQTDLLDSQPNIQVQSQITASEVLECLGTDPQDYRPLPDNNEISLAAPEDRCVQGLIFRLSSELTYAQLIHPSDVLTREELDEHQASAQTVICGEPHGERFQYTCQSRLFFEALEKGVIRRARVRGVFVPRQNDLKAVAACARRLSTQKLPLTT